jgi:nucleoid DNA-binding protein
MNKVNGFAGSAGSRADATKAVDAVLDSIQVRWQTAISVSLVGFGTFSVNAQHTRDAILVRVKPSN